MIENIVPGLFLITLDGRKRFADKEPLCIGALRTPCEVHIAERLNIAIIIDLIGTQVFLNLIEKISVDFFLQHRFMVNLSLLMCVTSFQFRSINMVVFFRNPFDPCRLAVDNRSYIGAFSALDPLIQLCFFEFP